LRSCQGEQALNELVVDGRWMSAREPAMQVCPVRRNAGDHAFYGIVEIGVVENDVGRFAASSSVIFLMLWPPAVRARRFCLRP